VHDWIWRRRKPGTVVSLALLKRLNLIAGAATTHRPNPSRDRKGASKAPALLLILLFAKLIMIWAHPAPLTAWTLLAYTWQDACVALAFAAFEFALPSRIARPAYWALVLYTAINIPVARVVSTPLTRPMLRAARGPLADSMLLYVTAANIAIVLSVLAAAAILPRLLRRVPRIWIVALLPLALLGPAASRRADTRGMDRNAVTALIGSRVAPAPANPETVDWRSSPFPARYETVDLSRFAGAARGFNVVLVSLESTAAQYLALYGAPESGKPGGKLDAMPNLSALARHSLVFENAYAVYPESIKGLFSVLCSTFPAFDSRPKAYENIGPPSLAAILAGEGYRTAMFHSGRFGYLGMESIIRNRGYQILEDAGNISGNHNSSFGVDEPATVTRMLSWIDALPRGQNFFLTYLPIAGHHPYATPDPGPFAATAEVDQYRNALHYGDASLGTLVQGLRARGLEQSTVWIVYGDHGEAFGQHNGNYGHTFLLYDENVHVPFLIAAPALMPGQQRVRKVVSLVDTAPTVLALLGIPPPANYQGATMLDATPRMALFFADYSLGLLGLRDGPWKFVYELNSKRVKLFDLDHDPGELSDISAHYPAQISWYSQTVRAWSSAQQRHIAPAVPNQ
jgi:glucan phosphoethanolaminetransferase (alkaline phosphatase superfamily)